MLRNGFQVFYKAHKVNKSALCYMTEYHYGEYSILRSTLGLES